MRHRVLSEAHVQRLWEIQPFGRLISECGRSVDVLFPGLRSALGPDFRAARIRIGEEILVGDVEIHLTPSGWREHGHEGDGAYEGVILHVVLDRDRFSLPGTVLVLRPFLSESAVALVRGTLPAPAPRWPEVGAEWGRLLESAGRLRWERRRARYVREAPRLLAYPPGSEGQ